MQHTSRTIDSPQSGPHKRLKEIVDKHIQTVYQKPIQTHNQHAFDAFFDYIQKNNIQELMLDSCCGTGMSTRRIAELHPDALVIGIDQSAARLNKVADDTPTNTYFIQANCEDFWRLCERAKLIFNRHSILYPNPYPKTEHLKRRWHGHPSFPTLKNLSNTIELRSNWHIYLLEFKIAWEQLTEYSAKIEEIRISDPLTLFERKYHESGQSLFKLTAQSNKVAL